MPTVYTKFIKDVRHFFNSKKIVFILSRWNTWPICRSQLDDLHRNRHLVPQSSFQILIYAKDSK
jgi:hypothetical protein